MRPSEEMASADIRLIIQQYSVVMQHVCLKVDEERNKYGAVNTHGRVTNEVNWVKYSFAL